LQLALTVVWPARDWQTDVVLDADPSTTVGDVTAEFARMAGGAFIVMRETEPLTVYADGEPLDPQCALADAQIWDGAVVSLGDPGGRQAGRRGGTLVVNVNDSSDVPSFAEPFFLTFNAEVEFRVAMTPEDLGSANLEGLGRTWK